MALDGGGGGSRSGGTSGGSEASFLMDADGLQCARHTFKLPPLAVLGDPSMQQISIPSCGPSTTLHYISKYAVEIQ